MTSIKYHHLQVMGTITGKFHQYSLKTVRGVAESRLCLRTDRRIDGRTEGRTHPYNSFVGTTIKGKFHQNP